MPETRMFEELSLKGRCALSGSKFLEPCVRNVFVVTSCEDPKENGILKFGQQFYLKTIPELEEIDRATFMKCAKKSRHQEILLTEETSFLSCWKVLCYDPQERLETEGLPIPANKKILICHCKTNQCLASLSNYTIRTPFGREHEITAQTFLDSHKAERPSNHWVFIKDENNQRLPSRALTSHLPLTSAPTATDHAGEGQNLQISNTDTT